MIWSQRDPSCDEAVAVFGATGHTGRFVVSELLLRGVSPIAIGRNASKLAGLRFGDHGIERREASTGDAGSLDRAFEGVTAVINCAGPFLDTAQAVASAALRARIHYLDITAEQASAQMTFATFDGPAREAGVVVMPAMGFFGGFMDLLVTVAMNDWEAVDEIRVGIALDRWHPTPGTRITGKKNTARRLCMADGKLVAMPQPPAETDWEFPDPFGRQKVVELPFSETILIARHVRASELHTYLGRAALLDIRDPTTPPPEAADETGLSAQRFLVEATVQRRGQTGRIVARGRDIYAFSAPLVCEAVQRILDGRMRDHGAQAPGAVFDARDFLSVLAPHGLTIEVANG